MAHKAKNSKKPTQPINIHQLPTIKNDEKLTLNRLRAIIMLFAVILYGVTISFDFTLDDTLMITSNELTKKGISGIPEIFSNDAFVGFFGNDKDLVAGGRYRPLTHAMFAVEYEFFGANPAVGHLMNVILYALLGLIVFNTLSLCIRNIPSKNKWISYIPFTATLLFIAHPLHTEVVANIKGRDEIISMGGSMLALLYSIRYIDKRKTKYLLFSFLSILFALFSKENAITFLAVVPLALYFFTNAEKKDYIMTSVPLLAASVIFLFARYHALGFLTSNTIQTEILNNPFIHSSKPDEIATVIYTWLIYLKLLIIPHPLTHDYYPWHLIILNFSNPRVIFAVIVVLLLLFLAVRFFRRKHMLSFGILFFVITFSIQSNLLFNIGTFMNERFMFVALLGFCLIVAYYIAGAGPGSARYVSILFFGILTLYSFKTISRSLVWKNNYTLFTTDVKVSVNSAKCNTSAAESLINRAVKMKDSTAARELFLQAYEYLKHAQNLHPEYYGAFDLAGKATFHLDDFRASYLNYRKCLEINPAASVPVDNIYLVSIAASQKGRNHEAIDMLTWLINFVPDSLHYKFELANIYEKTGNIQTAVDTLKSIISENSNDDKAWAKLGELYGKHFNDLNSSEKYLLKAAEINPGNLSVNENLGIVYGMKAQYQMSVDFFLKALAIDSTQSRLHMNIGNTYALMNQHDKAQFHFQKAAQLNAGND